MCLKTMKSTMPKTKFTKSNAVSRIIGFYFNKHRTFIEYNVNHVNEILKGPNESNKIYHRNSRSVIQDVKNSDVSQEHYDWI